MSELEQAKESAEYVRRQHRIGGSLGLDPKSLVILAEAYKWLYEAYIACGWKGLDTGYAAHVNDTEPNSKED